MTLFLNSLSTALKYCGEHATMSPRLVWVNLLLMILGLIQSIISIGNEWMMMTIALSLGSMIYTGVKINQSISRTLKAANEQGPKGGVKVVGAMFILCAALLPVIGIISFLIIWIICWVQIARYNKLLLTLLITPSDNAQQTGVCTKS